MKIQTTLLFLLLITSFIYAQNDSTNSIIDEIEIGGFVFEKMPEFVGGYQALQRYINSNAIYTEKARKENAAGTVYISFLVETDGSINEPIVLRGVNADLDSVSIDLVRKMPKWIPATQRERPIKCRFILPVKFTLNTNYCLEHPEISKYWNKRGRIKFFKICKNEFGKSEAECSCWFEFIIWNYNDRKINELDLKEIFKKQKCK